MRLHITEAGINAILYCTAESSGLTFTKIVPGNGASETDTVASPLTAFPNGIPIASVEREEGSSTSVVATATFNNSTMAEADYVTEIGIYAQDPEDATKEILYAYGCTTYAERTYIPAYSGGVVEFVERFAIYVGAETEVTVALNSGVYALKNNPQFTGDGAIEGDFAVGGYLITSDIKSVNDIEIVDGSSGGGQAKHMDYNAVSSLLDMKKLADMGLSQEMIRKLALLIDMHFGEEIDYTASAADLSDLALAGNADGNKFTVTLSGEYSIAIGSPSPVTIETGMLEDDVIDVYPYGIDAEWETEAATGIVMTVCVKYNHIKKTHSVIAVGDGSIVAITDPIHLGDNEYLFPIGSFEADFNTGSAGTVAVVTSSLEVISGGSSIAIEM